MTLNQVITRIKTLALEHKQLRNFYRGDVTDFLTDKTTRYASCFLQDGTGSIDPSGKATGLNFRLFLLDLVNVSENAKDNELEVMSDMLSIAEDLIAEMDHSDFYDWKLGQCPIAFVKEQLDDMVAGVVVDLSITKMFIKDVCAIPKN